MSPFQIARAAWHEEASIYSFDFILSLLLRTGHVSAGPDHFAMAETVHSSLGLRMLVIDARPSLPAPPDTWLIWCAAGRLDVLLSRLPYPLSFIAFQRRGYRIHTYHLSRLWEKARNRRPKSLRLLRSPKEATNRPALPRNNASASACATISPTPSLPPAP